MSPNTHYFFSTLLFIPLFFFGLVFCSVLAEQLECLSTHDCFCRNVETEANTEFNPQQRRPNACLCLWHLLVLSSLFWQQICFHGTFPLVIHGLTILKYLCFGCMYIYIFFFSVFSPLSESIMFCCANQPLSSSFSQTVEG